MKLTKKNVESLEPTGTRYEVRDDELIGFSIRVGATGEKSFYLTYRAGKGRAAPLKRLRIGTFPSMTVEQTRQIVKQKRSFKNTLMQNSNLLHSISIGHLPKTT